MVNFTYFRKIFQQIQVVKPPQRRLATFGTSSIEYHLVTDVSGLADRSRVRIGLVTAEKPALITPQSLKEKFSGFGPEASEYAQYLGNQYGDSLRGLEYQFRNEPVSNRVELIPPNVQIRNLSKDFEGAHHDNMALIRGTDKLWELSIMKFIVEETLTSFVTNVKELEERGFFEPEDRIQNQQKREIQNLLGRARYDKNLIPLLARKLKDYDLFDHFQDEFFRLVKP